MLIYFYHNLVSFSIIGKYRGIYYTIRLNRTVSFITLQNMVTHARKNIQTVDIYKDTYRMYKLLADEGRYEAKALINRVLERILTRELAFKDKYPNLSISSIVRNHITMIDENRKTGVKELIDLYYDDNYELRCERDRTTNCKHVSYVRNTEISNILMTKKDGDSAGKNIPKKYKVSQAVTLTA